MGEVLENGVYLPDEGERNAYNGLKGNWNTVDTVVAQVQALSSTGLIRKPVDELPTEDIETNVIYMLKAVKPNGDVYRIEYMYIDNHWDALGTSETTLDDYYTKAETDDLPAVKSGINATRVSNYDTHLANNDIHVTLANKQSWDGKQNALDTAQTAAVNSGVNATKVTGYDTHVSDTDIHVTTSDKAAWNGKQDGLSQTQLAAVNSGITEAKRTGYDNHVADTDVHVTTADKAAWNGKQNALTQTQLDNIAAVPDKVDSADLATVATTGDYGDLLNAPAIPTVNNATLTIQKNGADVATFTANASSNVTANLAIPTKTSELDNDAGFLTQHNPIDDELSATSENALQNKVVKSELDGKAPLVHTHAASDVTSGTFNIARIPNLDASKITSGTIDIARLPKGALERLVKVANQAARYALTTDDVQLGDTVQQLDTGVMYVVTDETKLDSADGYTEFTAGAASSVPWTGVTGKPNDYPPSSHTHTKSQITDFPTLATVATSGSYNDLNNIPASFTPSSHTHGNLTNDGKIGTAANKPLITGTGGVVQAGSFGNQANTFCEGNDSRLSDARTPVAHTHTKSDVTDLFNSANTWTSLNSYNQPIQITANFDIGAAPSSDVYGGFNFGNGTSNIGNITARVNSAGTTFSRLYIGNKFANGALGPNGTWKYVELQVGLRANGDRFIYTDGLWRNSLTPYDSSVSIGDSTHQWNNLYTSKIRQVDSFSSYADVYQVLDSSNKRIVSFRITKEANRNTLGINVHDQNDSAPKGLVIENDLSNNITITGGGTNNYLGTLTNQWKSVYAQSYYYNGVAWGLDKANIWTQDQTIATSNDKCYIIKDTVYELGQTYPNGEHLGGLVIQDKNGSVVGLIDITDRSYGYTEMRIRVQQKFDPNSNNRSTSGAILWNEMTIGIASDKTNYLRLDANLIGPNHDLGTSTAKWKTFNGINPGALSLPNLAYDGYIDLSDHISANTEYSYTPTVDGWLALYVQTTGFHTENAIAILNSGSGSSYRWACSATSGINLARLSRYNGAVVLPVKAGISYICLIKIDSSTTLAAKYLYFYKATGNV